MSLSIEAIKNGQELAQNNDSLKDGCCLLGWQLSSPCGESTLPNARIELDGAQIQSNQIKGSKIQWFPRSKLKLTTKYSNRVTRTFNAFGVKYGDFTVVPTTRLDELQLELESIERDWKDEVKVIIADYDNSILEHIAENPEIGPLIKKYALTSAEFEVRFKLRFTKPLAMIALFESDEDAIVSDVADTLWQELAKEAHTAYKQNWFKGGIPVQRVSQKVRSPFRRMMSKLTDLSFIDEGISNVLQTIEEVLDDLPNKGYIEGSDFTLLTNWLLVMANEDTLRLHAKGVSQLPDLNQDEIVETMDVAEQSTEIPPVTEAELPTEQPSTTTDELNDESDDERSSSLDDFGFSW